MDGPKDSFSPAEKMLSYGAGSLVLPAPSQSSQNPPTVQPSLVDRLVLPPAPSSQPSQMKAVMLPGVTKTFPRSYKWSSSQLSRSAVKCICSSLS